MSAHDGLAPQLLQLLNLLSKQGELHLTEIDADLQQTTDLLAHAIDKLSREFIGIHEAVAAQQAALASLPDGAVINSQLRAEITRLQQITDNHINAAVTALQFQDMTSQLIGRSVGHVVGLREVLQALGAQNLALKGDDQDGAAMGVLRSVNASLSATSIRQGTVARMAVAQTHMENGDIELF